MKKKITFLIIIGVLWIPSQIWSWGSHYLITLRALEHPQMSFLNREVATERLEDFVKKEKEGLFRVFKEYYEWLYQYHPHRMDPSYLEKPFDKQLPPLKAFLKAARLNPNTKFLLVNRVIPGQKARYPVVPVKKVYPFFRHSDFFYQFENVEGQKVTLRSILITFADEPDWSMDHHLWNIKEYGYGKQPYGEPEGESSKAPFHMLFMHEPFIVKIFAPFLLEGMTVDRIVLFTKLAKFAKKTGHEYWAHRFLAWAIHYYQDLAQPYHSKAVPEADFWYYIRYIFSSDKKAFEARTTQLLKNKHFIYEDFVSVFLEKSFYEPDSITDGLVLYLRKDPVIFPEFKDFLKVKTPDYEEIIRIETEYSSGHALNLDLNIQKIFGKKYTSDPDYDLERDKDYSVLKAIRSLDAEKQKLLLEETGKDFQMTGQITRFAILDLYNSVP